MKEGSPGLQAVVASEIPGRNLSWTEPTEHLASPGGTQNKCCITYKGELFMYTWQWQEDHRKHGARKSDRVCHAINVPQLLSFKSAPGLRWRRLTFNNCMTDVPVWACTTSSAVGGGGVVFEAWAHKVQIPVLAFLQQHFLACPA